MESSDNLIHIAGEVLSFSRNELCMSFPYMYEGLFALAFLPGEDKTVSFATDGTCAYFNSAYISDLYMRSDTAVNRLTMHVLMHCLLRHIGKKHGKDSVLWDLACDVAAESILDSLDAGCLGERPSPARQKFMGQCLSEMKVLTAEGVYRKLQRDRRSEYELAVLQREFIADDHGLWDPEKHDDDNEQQDEKWKNISSRVSSAMAASKSREANGGETLSEQVRVSARDDVDYRAFLRRFSAPKEIMKCDDDAFDPAYYVYGLQHYGNMPLIEAPETKEDRRIEDFVIAIDTSMSTSGALVRDFLSCTYSILQSTETFTRKLNIRIIQCDDKVRSDVHIKNMAELRAYMEAFTLTGGSATDFRPVFEHVEELQKAGALPSLRGLIYFTDGMGIYPVKRPAYDVAFVLLEEPPLIYKIPPWAVRLVLNLPEAEKTEALSELDDELAEEMPEL